MTKLTVPLRLSVTVLTLSAACGQSSIAGDATTMADISRTDSIDVADIADALDVPDTLDVSDVADTHDATEVAEAGDVLRDAERDQWCLRQADAPVFPEPGFQCAPLAGMVGMVTCASGRVCDRGECGAGCEGCSGALFCIPDGSGDGGPLSCTGITCDPTGCAPGCRAVG